jgi:MscS family membrane protein
VVTIPNSNFSSKEIENYSRRDRFLFNSTIGLTYDTSAQKMRVVLDAILKLLIDDKNVINDARVRFIAFNSSSLDIEIFAYIRTYQLEVFLAIREELLLKIMDIVADEGASMAFPTRTIVIQREDEI